jgi:hypothetical protein
MSKSAVILFKLTTRSRPELAFRALDSIVTNLFDKESYMIIVSMDSGDATMNNSEVIERLKTYKNLTYHFGNSKTKIEAINADVDKFPDDWSILVNFSDDQVIIKFGFDDIIRASFGGDYSLLLHLPDGSDSGNKIPTMHISGIDRVKKTGTIYNPAFYSVMCDNYEKLMAIKDGKYKFVNENIYEHLHWRWEKAPMDELYLRNDTHLPYRKDKITFHELVDMPLLVVYPTRGRKKMFLETLANLHTTIGTHKVELIINCDLNDPEMNDPELMQEVKSKYACEIYFDEQVSKIHACNRNINKAKTNWKWCLLLSDDQKFIVPNWYDKMIEDIFSVWGYSLDFFAHFADGYVNEKLPTLNVCGVDYYKRFNYLYHPSYGSVSSDAENFWVSQMLGKHHYFPQIYFNHLHPSNLNTSTDATYRGNDKFGAADTQNYFDRMKRYFDVPECDRLCVPEKLQDEINNLK